MKQIRSIHEYIVLVYTGVLLINVHTKYFPTPVYKILKYFQHTIVTPFIQALQCITCITNWYFFDIKKDNLYFQMFFATIVYLFSSIVGVAHPKSLI